MNEKNVTDWIALSERAYRALLILYPADYRREYGALMVQFFRDVTRERYRRQGLAGIALWWCKTMLDLMLTVIEQRRKVSFTMSKAAFVQLTEIFLIVGGALIAAASFSQFQPDEHYTYYGIYQILLVLVAPGFALMGLGCIGLGMRYADEFGRVMQWTLYLAAAGAIVMFAAMIAMIFMEVWWNIWIAGALLHVIPLTAFGLLHAAKPVLPIFRWLPLQIASGWLIIGSGILRTDVMTTNNLLSFLMFFGIGLAWLAIGLTIQRQRQATALATA